jgi:DNA mismatch repair protein MutL
MSRIQVLPDIVANKIAAGEVVERPASVVKELLENSLDAGTRQLKVEIAVGGKQLIRITDDGEGMTREDALLAFERHATSKLRHIEDLEHIQTLGFRGEALASIASVAQVSLCTKTPGELIGTQIKINGGRLTSVDDIAWPGGTEITVRDLFFNVPARRKFLKGESVEAGHISGLLTNYALANPTVGFTLINQGRSSINTVPVESLRDRAYQLFGDEFLDNVVEVAIDSPIKIQGFVSQPSFQRLSRDSQYLFVNRRFVRDRVLNRAISDAYKNILPSGAFPAVLLLLEMLPEEVDVNVHPAKSEVRFRQPQMIIESVVKAIHHALSVTKPFARFPLKTTKPSVETATNDSADIPNPNITNSANATNSNSSTPFSPDNPTNLANAHVANSPRNDINLSNSSSNNTLPPGNRPLWDNLPTRNQPFAVPSPFASGVDADDWALINATPGLPTTAAVAADALAVNAASSLLNTTDTVVNPAIAATADGQSPLANLANLADLSNLSNEGDNQGTTFSQHQVDALNSNNINGVAATSGAIMSNTATSTELAAAVRVVQDVAAQSWQRQMNVPVDWLEVRLLGQLHNSYLVAADAQGLLLIDQHVAHERILFEQHFLRLQSGQIPQQQMLIPITFNLTPAQSDILETVLPELEANGFEVMRLSGRGLAIKAVPSILPLELADKLFQELLTLAEKEHRELQLADFHREIAASVACQAAIKINTPLTTEKMEWLIQGLFQTQLATNCPHGRPIVLRLTMREIERAFQRT